MSRTIHIMLAAALCFIASGTALSYEDWVNFQNEYHINDIAVEGDLIWCATNTGVFSYDKVSRKEHWLSVDDIFDNSFVDVAIDYNGIKWFVSSSFIVTYDGNEYTTYSSNDYFPNRTMNAVAVDKDNVKWFATSKGIFNFDGTDWKAYYQVEVDSRLGNVTKTFIDVCSVAVDSLNTKWFGTKEMGVFSRTGFKWEYYERITVNESKEYDLERVTITDIFIQT